MMTTEETAKLYIEHAADFRELLGNDDQRVAELGTAAIYLPGTGCMEDSWPWRGANWSTRYQLDTALAVAAMTEAWRERLQEKHSVVIRSDGVVECVGQEVVAYIKDDDGGWSLNLDEAISFTYAPEAICAAVKAMAAVKRAETKVHTIGLDKPHNEAPSGRLPDPHDYESRLDMLEGIVRRIDNQLGQVLNRGLPPGIEVGQCPNEENYKTPPTRKDPQ